MSSVVRPFAAAATAAGPASASRSLTSIDKRLSEAHQNQGPVPRAVPLGIALARSIAKHGAMLSRVCGPRGPVGL